MNPYENLQLSNPGNAFMQAFQGGAQMRRESETRNALAKYATNPEDPEVFSELSKWNPEMAIQIRGQQQQQHMQALEQHQDSILKGAQIVRQLQPQDQATWDQALGMAAQMGIDTTQVPREYNPQYVQGLTALADAFAKPAQDRSPSSVQEYEYAKQQGFGGSYMDFMEEKRGPIVANNGDGTFTLIPRGQTGGQSAPPPPPPGFVIDQGGPTPQASGNFPR